MCWDSIVSTGANITKLQVKAIFLLQDDTVEENFHSFSAVPLTSNSNIAWVGSLLANIASGVAKAHLTFAVLMSNINLWFGWILQLRFCKTSAKNFYSLLSAYFNLVRGQVLNRVARTTSCQLHLFHQLVLQNIELPVGNLVQILKFYYKSNFYQS